MSYTEKIFEYAKELTPGMYWISVIESGKASTMRVSGANKTNDCYSVSKVFTVTALGMLFDDGLLDTNEKIVDIFKDELPDGIDPKWNDVTIHMVMLHRWGIANGFLDIDSEDINSYEEKYCTRNDFLKIVLSSPLPLTPGDEERYSDAAYYLLSRVVSKKCGKKLYDLLNERLFNPMEFEETAWSACPMGYSMGATGLFIRSGDIAKLGQLYLDKGIYKGKRIISEKWCDIALERGYELNKIGDGRYCKGGFLGQMLYVDVPRDLSVSWLCVDENGVSTRMMDFIKSM